MQRSPSGSLSPRGDAYVRDAVVWVCVSLNLPRLRRDIGRSRLKVLAAIGAACVMPLLAAVLYFFTDLFFSPPEGLASQPSEAQWAMFGRDLAHSGAATASGPQTRGSVKWTFATGAAIHSSPAVVAGVVYFGSQDSRLYALDAETGEVVWTFETGSWVQSSPAVVDGTVYFGANDGWVRALDAKTGQLRWAHQSRYPITSSPAVAGGRVYVGTTTAELLALDASTGKRRWSTRLDGDVYDSSPAVANGLVYVGTLSPYFYSLHAGDGRIRLWFLSRGDVISSPAVAGATVYFTTTSGRLFAVDGTSRNFPIEHRLRRLFLRMRLIGLPAPAVSAQSGHLWELDVGEHSASSPMVSGDTVYVGADRDLVAVDTQSVGVRWRFRTQGSVSSSPRLAGEIVMAASEDGTLYGVHGVTGQLSWAVETGGKITSSPAVAHGAVYVGSHDGLLYAIR